MASRSGVTRASEMAFDAAICARKTTANEDTGKAPNPSLASILETVHSEIDLLVVTTADLIKSVDSITVPAVPDGNGGEGPCAALMPPLLEEASRAFYRVRQLRHTLESLQERIAL